MPSRGIKQIIKKGDAHTMKAVRLMAVLLIVAMAFSLCSCGKVEEKIAEKSAEMLLEKALGADVDITKDGSTINVGGGAMEVGEDLSWPKEAMGDMPELKGKVTFIMRGEENKGATVTVSDVKPDIAKEYISILEGMCSEGGIVSEDSEYVVYSGKTDKGASIIFQYSQSDMEAVITYSSAS
jgi:hypothetical protein